MNPEQWVLFSPEDEDLSWYRWNKTEAGYAIGKLGWAHRVVLSRSLGRDLSEGEVCDHINFIKHDNRRENLRPVTSRQNAQHRPISREKFGLRGASFHKTCGKWSATVTTGGKVHHVGLFDTEEQAAQAAAAKRAELGMFGSEPVSEIPHRLIPRTNTTGFPYVFRTRSSKWEAKFRHKRKKFHLGLFEDPKTAYEAVVAKRNELGIDTPYRPRQEAA